MDAPAEPADASFCYVIHLKPFSFLLSPFTFHLYSYVSSYLQRIVDT